MERRQALLSLIALILVTWLLVSSLSEIANYNVSGGSSSGPGTPGPGGSLGGTGQGSSGLGGGLGLKFPSSSFNFIFPNINLDFLTPIFNAIAWFFSLFPLPNIRFPTLKLPSTHFPGNSATGSSGGGSGSSSQNQNPNVIPLLTNEYILIFIAIITIIFIIFMLMRNANIGKTAKKEGKTSTNEVNLEIPDQSTLFDNSPMEIDHTHGRKFLFSKISTPLKGWGGNDLLTIPISNDLPLVWSDSTPLKINSSGSSDLKFNDVSLNEEQIVLPYGLNTLTINSGNEMTVLELLGIPYEEHVRDSTIVNIPENIRTEILSKTLLEVYSMNEMKNEFMNHESIRDAITICERVIYGKKILKREEYEKFLRSLGNGFISPHITWMVRKNGN